MTSPNEIKSPNLPNTYTTRSLTFDDAEAIVAFQDSASLAKGYQQTGSVDVLLSDWQEPDFNLEESSILVESDGEIMGYAVLVDNAEKPVKPWCVFSVKHDLYGTDLPRFLLTWLENKAQRVFDKCPDDVQIVLQTNCLEGYTPRVKDLTEAGFSHTRNFYRMLIEMDSAPPQAQLPENISMRGLNYPDEVEAMAKAVELGFKDHWGFVEESIEETLKSWTHYLSTDTLFDPELYFLAIDDTTDEIAGVALCRIEQYGKPEVAYVEELAVLPNYRRQGLALAMLQYAFGKFYEKGRKKVALHVDADSLTGATRLYTKAGMETVETWMNYQKILREGIDISTTSVE
ncbi:MAG: GNAT family N-acetyltransferase [Phototrophicaceae bacterium]